MVASNGPMPFPAMSTRLLSFLTGIEKSIQADDPSPQDGTWENSRTINFQLGLARLALASKSARDPFKPLGGIVLQVFALADGSLCLRATLSWAGHDSESDVAYSVYAKAGVDWDSEARRIAAAWQNGPAEVVKAAEPAEELAVAG
jgi:hypothetical protein